MSLGVYPDVSLADARECIGIAGGSATDVMPRRNETAHRALQVCGRVFRFAVASGRAERDPSRDLSGALAPTKEKHLASITDPAEVGALLRAIDAYEGAWITRCALRLAPLVFVRPGELRAAQWAEFDFEKAE